jgi:hypothetical protein
MLRSVLTALCIGAAAPARADIEQQLVASGFVEADASGLRAWNSRADRVFTVSRDDSTGCLLIDVGRGEYSRDLDHTEGAYRYEGTDNGEWGGELTLTDRRGRRVTLVEDNVHSLMPTGDGLFVLTGLSHMSLSRGAIYRVRSPGLDPKIERVTLLPDAPAVALVDARRPDLFRTIIIGYSTVMVFTSFGGDEQIEVLMVDAPWGALYPDSAVMLDDSLVFGMRGGIGVVQLAELQMIQPAPRYFTLEEAASPAEKDDGESVSGTLSPCVEGT